MEAHEPDEMSLCRWWEAQPKPELRTTTGVLVQIIYRGQWSRGFGPDFRNAILCFDDGPAVRGDVEIHVHSGQWYEHGHPANPDYDSVIMHVVWSADVTALRPTVQLCGQIPREDLLRHQGVGRLDNTLCAVFRDPADGQNALRIVEAAGDARFEARARAFEGELDVVGAEQALYAGLMEALGYSANKLPFRMLAEAVPLLSLPLRDGDRIRHMLEEASGLVPGTKPILNSAQWRTARIRPVNHPLRRIHGMAELLARAHGDLVQYLTPVASSPEMLIERLVIDAPQGPAFIGRDRAIEMAANVVLPFTAALARSRDDDQLEQDALSGWRTLPRSAPNWIERTMRTHLDVAPRKRLLSTARHQQGLLHMYKRYCAHRLCALCPLSRLASNLTE